MTTMYIRKTLLTTHTYLLHEGIERTEIKTRPKGSIHVYRHNNTHIIGCIHRYRHSSTHNNT